MDQRSVRLVGVSLCARDSEEQEEDEKEEGGRRKWKISVYARNRIIYRAEILKAEDCRRPRGIDTP